MNIERIDLQGMLHNLWDDYQMFNNGSQSVMLTRIIYYLIHKRRVYVEDAKINTHRPY